MRFPQADLSGLNAFDRQWPIGSVVTLYTDDDPAVLFGYGVWQEIGQGRVLVGKDAGQAEFDAIGETGGVKDVTLTAEQSGLPQHTHVQDAHSHTSVTDGGTIQNNGAGNAVATTNQSGATGTIATTAVAAVNQNAGPVSAAQAHTNLPPYEIVRHWRRTG